MEGVDRLNELKDEMLVNNTMSRLDCTTKEVIQTTAAISKRWKNLWTSLPHLFFSISLVNSEFKSRANSWIRYAIRRNVEEVDLWLFDVGVGQDFTFEDELFFNTSCITLEVDLKYTMSYREFVIFAEEVFRGLLESLGHVKRITFGDHCSELLSRLKAGSDTSDVDRAENGDREEQIASSDLSVS
ncbi:hypothetical protein Tco_1561509 [Tanacetum coccineum]